MAPRRLAAPQQHNAKKMPSWRLTQGVLTETPVGWNQRMAEHEAEFRRFGAHPGNSATNFAFFERALVFSQEQQRIKTNQLISRSMHKLEKRRIRNEFGLLGLKQIPGEHPVRTQQRRQAAINARRQAKLDPASYLYSPPVSERLQRTFNVKASRVRLWATFQYAEALNWSIRSANGLSRTSRPGRANFDWWTKTARARQDASDLKNLLGGDKNQRRALEAHYGRSLTLRERRHFKKSGTLLSARDKMRLRLVQARVNVRKALWVTAESSVRGVINSGKIAAAVTIMGVVKTPAMSRSVARVYKATDKALDRWYTARQKAASRFWQNTYKATSLFLDKKGQERATKARERAEVRAKRATDRAHEKARRSAERTATKESAARTASRESTEHTRAQEPVRARASERDVDRPTRGTERSASDANSSIPWRDDKPLLTATTDERLGIGSRTPIPNQVIPGRRPSPRPRTPAGPEL